jgi:catechol 2,3-dioxygenase
MDRSNGRHAPRQAAMPVGLSHVVLNVRDLEAAHRFYTEIIGFKQSGEWRPRESNPRRKMRFYSGTHRGETYHHDLALVEMPNLPPRPDGWNLDKSPQAVNHVAVLLPDRETWLEQLEFLQAQGVKFHRRINHGMAHSVYISDPDGYGVELLYELPRETWEGGINEALNYVESLPLEGEAALQDATDVPVFGKAQRRDTA